MSRFPEINSLFAALASNLLAPDSLVQNEIDISISNLSRSLNLIEPPRVRILDTALSLMCFPAPKVCDSIVEFTLKTIVTVLSSSVECKELRINKEQVLRVGGLISKSDCSSLMDRCADISRKLGSNKGDLFYLLMYNIFRVAALAPCFPHSGPSKSERMNTGDSKSSALANLVGHLPKEFALKNGETPLRYLLKGVPEELHELYLWSPDGLRLLLWHLDPMILKQDVSEILREIIKRPLLSLRMEIYERVEWRSIMICLVLFPTMFVETRAFLHSWFLMTGLASVMELQSEIVGQMLDIITRPMYWGIFMDVGSKLLVSHAYFPSEHQLLRILAGPISLENFHRLLQKITGQASHVEGHIHTSSRKAPTMINVIDHKSMWSMAMNFPGWLSFASMMLFFDDKRPGAANFIAWILNPMIDSNQPLLIDYLVKVSDLWTLRYSSPNKHDIVTGSHKETRRLKLHDKDVTTSNELDSWIVYLWLKEFKDMYSKHYGKKVGFSGSNINGFGTHQKHLLRRIPLGILLLYPHRLNETACLLLLHYAATGSIINFSGKQIRKSWKNKLCGGSETWIVQCTKPEAAAGCRTVFDITDIAMSICYSFFETEEEGMDFVFQVKLKCCDYLLKCIKRLLQIEHNGNGFQMQRDILTRVLRWRNQGKDVKENKDLDFVCDALGVKTV